MLGHKIVALKVGHFPGTAQFAQYQSLYENCLASLWTQTSGTARLWLKRAWKHCRPLVILKLWQFSALFFFSQFGRFCLVIVVATPAVSRCAGTMPRMSVVLGMAAGFRLAFRRFVDTRPEIEHDSICLERAWKHRCCAADALRAIEEHFICSILLTWTPFHERKRYARVLASHKIRSSLPWSYVAQAAMKL